jgi:predicted glycogen debranching enzyme
MPDSLELSAVDFGRSVCGELAEAERREWLVANGIGGYASGTIAGTLTRRYHGLLVAALKPPVERTLLFAKIDESVTYAGATVELGANRWKDGYVAPQGWLAIERFYLDGAIPVWHYAVGDALIEKRVWMEHGENTTYVRYRLLRADAPAGLSLRCFANYRGFHGNTHAGDWHVGVDAVPNGVKVTAYDGARPFWLLSGTGTVTVENVWYRDFVLSQETARGLDDRDDNLCVAVFGASLDPGDALTLIAGDRDPSGRFADDALARRTERDGSILAAWRNAVPAAQAARPWIARCALAADAFVVRRPIASDPAANSVIAGYHWFADWGRDTMISLPGLALATGRPEIAKSILLAFSRFVDGGMLPNFFPDEGETPQYNTVDAALWYVEAAARYVEATGDLATLSALMPSLRQVIEDYRGGTRYGIHMDDDGLIVANAPGVQLTWMDAKVGDWVVTPRAGKPVEIGALWYNALERMAALATCAGEDPAPYSALADRARAGFDRFWNDSAGCCYDVVDGPGGNDASLRPNQLFAVSLPHSPLWPARQRAVVERCAAELLTSSGLRTLAQGDPHFVAHYEGSPHDRDAAYHQGTVWPWLLGPFALAHARVFGDRARARSFLEPLAEQLADAGLGTLGEIHDAVAPFEPRGAIAQAWSIAETLRAWHELA